MRAWLTLPVPGIQAIRISPTQGPGEVLYSEEGNTRERSLQVSTEEGEPKPDTFQQSLGLT